jgi:diguanylate cyclase (GGDEF)-like protein
MEKIRTLVIEDDKVDQMAFKRFVKDENLPYNYDIAGSVSEAKKILDSQRFDITITDYSLGDGTAFDIFDLIKDTPIIIVTGSGDEEIAVKAMKAGAYDYLIKDRERNYLKVLPLTVENAIKHKQAEQALEETLVQLSKKSRYEGIISTVTRSIHQSLNLQEVLENAVDAMSKNINGVNNVSIYLVEGEEAVIKAYRGYSQWFIERVRRIPYPKGFTWKTIIDGKPIYCADVDQDTIIGPAGKEMGTKSYLSMPIHYEGKAMGALIINSLKKSAFDQEELKLLGTVARQIEVAINNAKQAEALQQVNEKLASLVNELEQRNRNITLLNQMSELLQGCSTARKVYNVIAQFANELFPTGSGALYIHNPSKNIVKAVAVWGQSPPDKCMFRPDECWALRRRQVHLVEDPRSEPLCQHLSHRTSAGYLCVPMMAQGKIQGLLHFQNSSIGIDQPHWMWERMKESTKQQLAVIMAESISLSLANLKLREYLHNQAIRDSLTGLFNRRYMEESLKREVHRATRKGISLGIVMLDIDHFKDFNDTFGHAAGDALLHDLGSFLQARIRRGDIACRYGGEEFMLILPESSLDDTRQRAEQLREEIKHLSVQHDGQSLSAITVSLGVAAFSEHISTVEAILRAADLALYRAKSEGRDRVVVVQSIE